MCKGCLATPSWLFWSTNFRIYYFTYFETHPWNISSYRIENSISTFHLLPFYIFKSLIQKCWFLHIAVSAKFDSFPTSMNQYFTYGSLNLLSYIRKNCTVIWTWTWTCKIVYSTRKKIQTWHNITQSTWQYSFEAFVCIIHDYLYLKTFS